MYLSVIYTIQLSISFREVLKMTDKEKQNTKLPEDKHNEHLNEEEEEIFSSVEIKIEEMAIDGICGVY